MTPLNAIRSWFAPSLLPRPRRLQLEQLEPRDLPASIGLPILDYTDNEWVPRVNGWGDPYPLQGYAELGTDYTVAVTEPGPVNANALQFTLNDQKLNASWNSWNAEGTRGFTREYSDDPAAWQFNTYNRLRFWINVPIESNQVDIYRNGAHNYNVGTYVKLSTEPGYSDEYGGNHFYHQLNLAPNGQWTRVILNMHPNEVRNGGGQYDPGIQEHPTGEKDFNYWDLLTRFYLTTDYGSQDHVPYDYLLDGFEFYQEPYTENDKQIYSLTGTYEPDTNRLLVCWSHDKNEDVNHEVRYSFTDIHEIGWDAATPAPDGEPEQGPYGLIEVKDGVVPPPLAPGGYNAMIYDSSLLPLDGQSVVYIAIKPQNSELFSQIAIPLDPLSRHRATTNSAASGHAAKSVAHSFLFCTCGLENAPPHPFTAELVASTGALGAAGKRDVRDLGINVRTTAEPAGPTGPIDASQTAGPKTWIAALPAVPAADYDFSALPALRGALGPILTTDLGML